MKFSLNLDEALFDDELDSFLTKDMPSDVDDIDDDFSEYDDAENVLPGPARGSDTGVAGELIALINDEWEAIQGYTNTIATLRELVSENPFYVDAIKVLEEISAEENAHVGQLQEVLKQISPNAAEIEHGTREAKSQLGLVGGKLQVQSWDEVKSTNNTVINNNDTDETCTLVDVDDEM